MSEHAILANAMVTKITEATGTGQVTCTIQRQIGLRQACVHVVVEDEGGEAVTRVLEIATPSVRYRRKFVASGTAGVITGLSIAANPICISEGDGNDMTVRLLASGTVAVLRRVIATALYIPDIEIQSA